MDLFSIKAAATKAVATKAGATKAVATKAVATKASFTKTTVSKDMFLNKITTVNPVNPLAKFSANPVNAATKFSANSVNKIAHGSTCGITVGPNGGGVNCIIHPHNNPDIIIKPQIQLRPHQPPEWSVTSTINF